METNDARVTAVATRDQVAPGLVEISVVMPCLNEAATLAICIRKAQAALSRHKLRGEIIVADNGSSDGSPAIAVGLGGRLIRVSQRGYGAAIRAGIEAAEGEYVVIGDADDSYDFSTLNDLVTPLRGAADLVVGNRFKGGIERGAMPWKHRYIGNPVLTSVGRLLFRVKIGDFHCGLRAVRKEAFEKMQLRTTGMEFATEMVIKAATRGLRIAEVPTTLHRDGRSRPSHLRPYRDGWRHLRFMLLFSPRWLFLIPGIALMAVGGVAAALLLTGPKQIAGVGFDISTLLIAAFMCLLGYQLIIFGLFTKVFAIREGFHSPDFVLARLFRHITLEVGLLAGALLCLLGLAVLILAFLSWSVKGFGATDPRVTMRTVIPAVVLMALGVQTIFASFFLSILDIHTLGWELGGPKPK